MRRDIPVALSKAVIEKILADLDEMQPGLEANVKRYVAVQECRKFFKNEMARLEGGADCLGIQ